MCGGGLFSVSQSTGNGASVMLHPMKVHCMRKAVCTVMVCRRNPGKEQSLPKGSTDAMARCAMLGSGTDGVAHGPPQRTGSLH